MTKPVTGKRPGAGKPKSTPVNRTFGEEFVLLGRDVKKSLMDFLSNWEKFRDITKNNYELGRMHLGLGNYRDALMRFKFVLWLDPRHVNAMYYLGATYMAMGKKKEAAEWYAKALKLKPDFEEAKYLLCVIRNKPLPPEQTPKRMPPSLAVEYFDGLAPNYNTEQLEVMKYEGHIQLANGLRAFLTPGRMDYTVLELGIGTGLCGSGIRDVASHITGVDISGAMIKEAMEVLDPKGRKVYDALIRKEALEFLKTAAGENFDIVMSGAMFSFVGDLDPMFGEIQRVLKPKGLFAFTADVQENGEGYSLDTGDARFHYSRPYLQELAGRHGFRELKLKEYAVYAEYPAWVCVYEKTS